MIVRHAVTRLQCIARASGGDGDAGGVCSRGVRFGGAVVLVGVGFYVGDRADCGFRFRSKVFKSRHACRIIPAISVYEILRWYQRRGYLITGTCKVAILAVVVGAGGGQRIAHGVVREVVGVRLCRCRRLIGDGERTTYQERCAPGGFRVPHLDFEIVAFVCKLQSVTIREGKGQRSCCVHVLCIRVCPNIALPDFHVMLCADKLCKHNPGTAKR